MIETAADSFDAAHFSRPATKVWIGEDLPPAGTQALREVLAEQCRTPGAFVCAFAPCQAPVSAVLQEFGFLPISVRTTYEMPMGAARPLRAVDGVQLARLTSGRGAIADGDVRALAAVVGATSRYFKDGRLPRQHAEALYVSWIENSLHRGYAADAVLAYDGERLVGLHTVRIKDDVGIVDLIGVVDSHQGRGLGRELLERGMDVARELGCARMRVVTEAENVGASRLYQRLGFLLTSTELVWHRLG